MNSTGRLGGDVRGLCRVASWPCRKGLRRPSARLSATVLDLAALAGRPAPGDRGTAAFAERRTAAPGPSSVRDFKAPAWIRLQTLHALRRQRLCHAVVLAGEPRGSKSGASRPVIPRFQQRPTRANSQGISKAFPLLQRSALLGIVPERQACTKRT